jgi:hypothetical protein
MFRNVGLYELLDKTTKGTTIASFSILSNSPYKINLSYNLIQLSSLVPTGLLISYCQPKLRAGVQILFRCLELFYSLWFRGKVSLLAIRYWRLRSSQSLRWSRNSSPFMELEVAVPWSLEPANGLYPEPSHTIPFVSILILPSHLRLSPKWSLTFSFSNQNFVRSSHLPMRATCRSHDLIAKECLVKTKNYEEFYYAIFYNHSCKTKVQKYLVAGLTHRPSDICFKTNL